MNPDLIYDIVEEVVYSILEEYINEVSVSKWKEAAKNSAEQRDKLFRASMDHSHNIDKIHGNESPRAAKATAEYRKDLSRSIHADSVAQLPDSKKSANKVLKAAKNSLDKREQAIRADQNHYLKVSKITGKNSPRAKKAKSDWCKSSNRYSKAENIVRKD